MAQVRDSRTSELIFEGTPLECVRVADDIGRDECLFDDVGLQFDPDAVLKSAREEREGLAAASTSQEVAEETRNSIKDKLAAEDQREKELRDEIRQARKRQSEARARVKD